MLNTCLCLCLKLLHRYIRENAEYYTGDEDGIPDTITSNNSPPFNGSEYKRYLTTPGINKHSSTPRWPQGNAEVERFNQPLGKALKTATIEGKVW